MPAVAHSQKLGHLVAIVTNKHAAIFSGAVLFIVTHTSPGCFIRAVFPGTAGDALPFYLTNNRG